ncbi:Sec-independent protein translocase protein TatB [Neisseria sp. Ec49-e6-T10]|uniref:Sec-independent protein translocase protein TatB n=1 Tax=Neisseria sp. Ec49-e6-T10 TaxID=3140744 RepID=UPI003EBA4A57
MFDISFAKLVVLGIVALIVLGPERLPAVARFAGLMIGRMQRFIANVKADMNQQLQETGLNNLHQDLRDVTQNVRDGVHNVLSEVQDSLKEASEHYDDDVNNTESTPNIEAQSTQAHKETITPPNTVSSEQPSSTTHQQNDTPPL